MPCWANFQDLVADFTLNDFQFNGCPEPVLNQKFLSLSQEGLDFFFQVTLADSLPFFGLIQAGDPQIDILEVTRQIAPPHNTQQGQPLKRFAPCDCQGSSKLQRETGRGAAIIGQQDFRQRQGGMLHTYFYTPQPIISRRK